MIPCKRVEIITNSIEAKNLCQLLARNGITAFSLIPNVSGSGHRGFQDADEITGAFQNSLILIACSPEQADRIVELVRPNLTAQGGICLTSDAQFMKH
ncbi:hypothetical protein QPK87_23265 [Kamptonema cortianum]|nr:hypothetical protein [Kamptonema cortianum]MDL5044545.1 hypothetical protein [Oscillatoria amoena NRMC-F 0135]